MNRKLDKFNVQDQKSHKGQALECSQVALALGEASGEPVPLDIKKITASARSSAD